MFLAIENFLWDRSRDQPQRCCLDCHSARQRRYNVANRAKIRAARILRMYGITASDYASLWEKQGGLCAICSAAISDFLSEPGEGRRKSVVDHCHNSGAVRGLLCSACNTAIGNLGDDPGRARAAARYLERSRAS